MHDKQIKVYFCLEKAKKSAAEILACLKQFEAVNHSAIVGSIRRAQKYVGDIDILVGITDRKLFIEELANRKTCMKYQVIDNELIKGNTSSGIPFEIIIVDEPLFIRKLILTTGPKDFREFLIPIFNEIDIRNCETEADIFNMIKLPYIKPSDRGNFRKIINLD